MKTIGKKTPLLLLLGLLLSCSADKGRHHASSVDGHYENTHEEAMQKYADAQRVVPEYHRSQGVIVGLPLVSKYKLEGLVEQILAADAKRVWMTTEKGEQIDADSYQLSRLKKRLQEGFSQVRMLPAKSYGQVTVWARDWAPLAAAPFSESHDNDDGRLRLLDFNYYSNREGDDSIPQSLSYLDGLPRVSVPVYNEGGNFMINDEGVCLMSDRVVEANAFEEVDGDMVLEREDIIAYYESYAGCNKVIIFDAMPHEGTGHIDMWAKFLNNDTILVGQIYRETVEMIEGDQKALQIAMAIQKYLDERAADLEAEGFRVLRIPMPSPVMGRDPILRSYTNSLLLNGTAIVPQYIKQRFGQKYEDHKLLPAYEKKVRQAYEAAGFDVVFSPSDALIFDGGAIHCVTMQIPAF